MALYMPGDDSPNVPHAWFSSFIMPALSCLCVFVFYRSCFTKDRVLLTQTLSLSGRDVFWADHVWLYPLSTLWTSEAHLQMHQSLDSVLGKTRELILMTLAQMFFSLKSIQLTVLHFFFFIIIMIDTDELRMCDISTHAYVVHALAICPSFFPSCPLSACGIPSSILSNPW